MGQGASAFIDRLFTVPTLQCPYSLGAFLEQTRVSFAAIWRPDEARSSSLSTHHHDLWVLVYHQTVGWARDEHVKYPFFVQYAIS